MVPFLLLNFHFQAHVLEIPGGLEANRMSEESDEQVIPFQRHFYIFRYTLLLLVTYSITWIMVPTSDAVSENICLIGTDVHRY